MTEARGDAMREDDETSEIEVDAIDRGKEGKDKTKTTTNNHKPPVRTTRRAPNSRSLLTKT